MSSDDVSDQIIKGVLATQILSVPFSCSISCMALILWSRFLSKTSSGSDRRNSYNHSNNHGRSNTRLTLARWGASLVTIVCVAMTVMELTIVYETAVVHSGDKEFLTRVPWTSSLVPLLTALVSIATQTFFSERAFQAVQRPRLLLPVLIFLGFGSLGTGFAATIAILIHPFQTADETGVSAAEALFWTYLIFTTISSGLIMVPLIGSYLKDRTAARIEAIRTADSKGIPTFMTSLLRLFLSTYTMVFIFDLMCLITSLVSASANVTASIHASEAFLVVQKLMVRVMAVSYLYTLLDELPKSHEFESVNNPKGVQPEFNVKKLSMMANGTTKGINKSKVKDIKTSATLALSRYESSKQPTADQDEEGQAIYSYAYPPNVMTPFTADVKTVMVTSGTPITASAWEPVGYGYEQHLLGRQVSNNGLPLNARKPQLVLPSLAPARSASPSPPSFVLPPIPNLHHPQTPSPQKESNQISLKKLSERSRKRP